MTPPPQAFQGGAITLGNFDGVHLGHRALVQATRRWADRLGGPAVALTFDPPPGRLLAPGSDRPPLLTLDDRVTLLHQAGADHVAILNTEASLLSLSPEAFVEDLLIRGLLTRAVIEGFNFRFGRGREGDTATLRRLCSAADIAFEEVPPCQVRGEPVSSSRIRAALAAGDVTQAAELLGRAYAIAGPVVSGAKRGRTLGFPTANLDPVETFLPAEGVYAVRVTLPDGATVAGAANIGANPTFGEDARKIEIHLLDYQGDLYGTRLSVAFVARIRATVRFTSVADLRAQLDRDIAATRDLVR